MVYVPEPVPLLINVRSPVWDCHFKIVSVCFTVGSSVKLHRGLARAAYLNENSLMTLVKVDS